MADTAYEELEKKLFKTGRIMGVKIFRVKDAYLTEDRIEKFFEVVTHSENRSFHTLYDMNRLQGAPIRFFKMLTAAVAQHTEKNQRKSVITRLLPDAYSVLKAYDPQKTIPVFETVQEGLESLGVRPPDPSEFEDDDETKALKAEKRKKLKLFGFLGVVSIAAILFVLMTMGGSSMIAYYDPVRREVQWLEKRYAKEDALDTWELVYYVNETGEFVLESQLEDGKFNGKSVRPLKQEDQQQHAAAQQQSE